MGGEETEEISGEEGCGRGHGEQGLLSTFQQGLMQPRLTWSLLCS